MKRCADKGKIPKNSGISTPKPGTSSVSPTLASFRPVWYTETDLTPRRRRGHKKRPPESGWRILLQVLIKAASFVLMIALGYTLKRVGFFKKEDFSVLSRIVLNITLPCAIITNFSAFEFQAPLMLLAVLALLCCLILAGAGWLRGRKAGPEAKGFYMLNTSGYNIGCFTMPYVQSFLGPAGVVATCIFDAGNAVMCNGGTYGLASSISKGGKLRVGDVAKKMITSVPFDTYIIMVTLALLKVPTPDPVLTFTSIVGSANSFLSMLMIGVGFELKFERKYLSKIGVTLLCRYSLSAVFALLFYFLLPFPLEIRQVAVIVAFAPISAASVPYTEKIDGDVGLASAINSSAIVVSIVIITVLLMVMGL